MSLSDFKSSDGLGQLNDPGEVSTRAYSFQLLGKVMTQRSVESGN